MWCVYLLFYLTSRKAQQEEVLKEVNQLLKQKLDSLRVLKNEEKEKVILSQFSICIFFLITIIHVLIT